MNNGANKSLLSYEAIKSIAEGLNVTANKMETVLTNVKSQLNTTNTDEVWSGDAAAVAREKFDELSAKFPEFSQAVAAYSAYLNEVVERFRETDRRVGLGTE